MAKLDPVKIEDARSSRALGATFMISSKPSDLSICYSTLLPDGTYLTSLKPETRKKALKVASKQIEKSRKEIRKWMSGYEMSEK